MVIVSLFFRGLANCLLGFGCHMFDDRVKRATKTTISTDIFIERIRVWN